MPEFRYAFVSCLIFAAIGAIIATTIVRLNEHTNPVKESSPQFECFDGVEYFRPSQYSYGFAPHMKTDGTTYTC